MKFNKITSYRLSIGFGKDPEALKLTNKSEELYNMWIKKYKITGYQWNGRVVNLSESYDRKRFFEIEHAPMQDHCGLYLTAEGKRLFVYQPYGDLSNTDKNIINTWGENRGLAADFIHSDKSWHYPGRTSVVILSIKDIENFNSYIEQYYPLKNGYRSFNYKT